MTAIDKSPAALEVARRNAAKHQLGEDRIVFVESDLMSALPADAKFDLVLSNPLTFLRLSSISCLQLSRTSSPSSRCWAVQMAAK